MNELKLYIQAFFDLPVPDTQVCTDHTTPMQFINDLFFEKHSLMLAIACRNGYKTLLVAIADVLDMVFKGAGIIHAGAIEEQANKGYGYVRHYLSKNFHDLVDGEVLMSKTTLVNGGRIQVYPMTMGKMSGPHESKLRRDETDLAKQDALQQSMGIPSEQEGVQIGIVDISTRYFSYGNIQKMIDEAAKKDRKVFVWCYKEVAQRCPDERSGIVPVKIRIDREALHALSLAEYASLSRGEQEAYEEFEVFDKCIVCPLVATCCGDLKRSNGNQSFKELLLKYQDSSAETWISQMECRRALNIGVIFKKEFKRRYHIIKKWSFKHSEKGRYDFYRCLDFGRTRPSVGWIAHDRDLDVDIHFAELEPEDVTIEKLKEQVKKIDEKWELDPSDFAMTWCDPAGTARTDMDENTRIQRLKDGYDMKPKIPGRIGVWNGIEVVKRRLRIDQGRTHFQIVESNCPVTIQAFEQYHKQFHKPTGLWLNQPEDPQEFEHPMDRVRYYMVGRYANLRFGGKVIN